MVWEGKKRYEMIHALTFLNKLRDNVYNIKLNLPIIHRINLSPFTKDFRVREVMKSIRTLFLKGHLMVGLLSYNKTNRINYIAFFYQTREYKGERREKWKRERRRLKSILN